MNVMDIYICYSEYLGTFTSLNLWSVRLFLAMSTIAILLIAMNFCLFLFFFYFKSSLLFCTVYQIIINIFIHNISTVSNISKLSCYALHVFIHSLLHTLLYVKSTNWYFLYYLNIIFTLTPWSLMIASVVSSVFFLFAILY